MAAILINDTDWTEVSASQCRVFQEAQGVTYILYSVAKPDLAVKKGEAILGEESVVLDEPIYGQSIWARTREGDEDQTLHVFDLPKRFDPIGGVPTSTEIQNAVHRRRAFYSAGKNTALAAGATIRLYAVIGARQVHFDSFSVKSTAGGFSIGMYSGPTVSSAGTPVLVANRFMEPTPAASTISVYLDPTVTDFGLAAPEEYEPLSGANPAKLTSTGTGIEGGFVIAANTEVILEIRNDSTLEMGIGWVMAWHESTIIL